MTRRRRHRAESATPSDGPPCAYCKKSSKPATGVDVFPHRPDLAGKHFFRCVPCDARVGCHPGTWKPLGRLANAALRIAKVAAHAAFDALWKKKMERAGVSKYEARTAAYAWLAGEMGIEPQYCHIGEFDEIECATVVEICSTWRERKEKAA